MAGSTYFRHQHRLSNSRKRVPVAEFRHEWLQFAPSIVTKAWRLTVNRIPGFFGVAALIFTLGIFSGNFITLSSRTSADSNVAPEFYSTEEEPVNQLASLPDNWPDEETDETDSFAEFAQSSGVTNSSSIQLTSATASSDAADDQQIRQAIMQEFPDLDEATLDGWAAGYAGTPLEILQPLLQQKKLMPSIVPASTFSDHGYGSGESQKQSATGPNAESCSLCRKNLENAFTIGYRRQTQLARLTDVTSAAPDKLELLTSFDFTPGAVQQSSSSLHAAIEGNPNLFFQLSPGNVLTRCGTFERLEDGSIGVMHGEDKLVLSGTSKIPFEATNIIVKSDGTISYSDVESESQSGGRIVLVEVRDLSSLSSSNGVYFTANAASESQTASTEQTCIVSPALESSNVNSDMEWKHFEHFKRLAESHAARK